MATRQQAALGVRTILKYRATSLQRGTDVVVAHDAGQQNHRLGTEDWTAAANPVPSRLARDIGSSET